MYHIEGSFKIRSGAFAGDIIMRLGLLFDRDGITAEGRCIQVRCRRAALPDNGFLAKLDALSVYIEEGCIYIGMEMNGPRWRYRFCRDDERFVREKAETVWEDDSYIVYCGRGRLVLTGDDGPGESESSMSLVLSCLEDLFTDVCADGSGISIGLEWPNFDPEYTASCLKFISPYIQEGTIIIGRADDGPGLKDVKRWRYVFRDGQMSCQQGVLNWE